MIRLLLVFLLLVGMSLRAEECKYDVLNDLNLSWEHADDFYAVKYCPDNTCDVFEYKINDNKKILDYLILFFYYKSDYIYIKSWRAEPKVINAVRDIQSSYGMRIDKIFLLLQSDLKIKHHFIRYDEGIKSKILIDEE